MKDFYEQPYQLDATRLRRFDQKHIGFARAQWDESFCGYGRPILGNAAERQRQGLAGYSREEFALQTASWTVYDTFAGAFSSDPAPDLPGDAGPVERTADPLTEALGPYAADSARSAAVVKRAAQVFGACAAGIAPVNPLWIYSHRLDGRPLELPGEFRFAVVMLVEMDDFGIACSPAVPGGVATGNGYSRMAFAQACMAQFLRNLGYRAWPAGNDTALSVPLAVDAGLGEFGRNGLLIHPVLGQRVRICKVFTDLPLEPDRPVHFGAKRFCATCMNCAKHCPSRSIPFDRDPTWESPHDTPSNNSGARKWYVDVDSCYEFWTRNGCDCSNCIRVCPFTKNPGWIHDVPRFFIRHLPALNRLLLHVDRLLGYGRRKDPAHFLARDEFLGKKRY